MTRHRKTGTPEFNSYHAMRHRCTNQKHKDYHNYGGRGIGICDRWLRGDGVVPGIDCFFSDMGDKPSPSHSLDRIDNDRGYSPENCRWATVDEQIENRHRTIRVEGLTLKQIAADCGLPPKTIRARYHQGRRSVASLTTRLWQKRFERSEVVLRS